MTEIRDDLVRQYFSLGFKQNEILTILAHSHGIIVSKRHLQRLLQGQQLFRRINFTDINDVVAFISAQLEQSGQRLGYRLMHQRCLLAGLTVQKEMVRLIILTLDPVGVRHRQMHRLRRRVYHAAGPNVVWHLDGYDKLKPYGLCVHGCIDGFSRCIIWLKVHHTNSDPKVIANYFVQAVKENEGVPTKVRSDMGNEKGYIAQMQTFLGGSFVYGTSQHNQRIESWWSQLRKGDVQFWIELFGQLKNDDKFDGDTVDKNLVQFCFTKLVQVNITHW
jgi:hypothetical protein